MYPDAFWYEIADATVYTWVEPEFQRIPRCLFTNLEWWKPPFGYSSLPHWENLDMLKALFYSPTLCFNYSKCKWMMIKLKTRLWTMCSFSSAKFWPLKTCQRNCAKRVNSMTWSEDVFGVNHFIVYILYFYINEQRMNILMYIHYIIYIYFSWYTDKTFINYKLLVCLEHEHHWLGCSVGW